MHRKFLRDTLICLVPVVICAWLVVAAYLKYKDGKGGFKLGVDLAGGTTLIYEIDPELTKELKGGPNQKTDQNTDSSDPERGTISSEEMAELAAALKRRIDPNDLKSVQIRPVGRTRIEIKLPTGGATEGKRSDFTLEEVEEVKVLVNKIGSLEFRIVANESDDKDAIDAAQSYIIDPANKKELDERARKGLPPLFPMDREYMALGDKSEYAWVELRQEERKSLKLENAQETTQPQSELWREMEAARNEGKTYLHRTASEGRHYSFLLFSRNCVSERLNVDDRADKKYEYFMLTRSSDSVKVGGNITITASVGQIADKGPPVDFVFNSEGGRKFYDVTFKNKPSGPRDNQIARQLAIILDGMLASAPTINSAIGDRGQITGDYTHKDAVQLVNLLRSGALTAVLKRDPLEKKIPPTLGQETIKSGTMAVVLSFLAILGFMLFYYRFAGFVASIALLANLLLTVGFMVGVNATFTLPGLAGLVLMLGMAVDANVLIYERLREERDRGASLQVAIRNGYERAFPTIIDTHLSSIFTAIVLYAVGNAELKGFGISLTVGLVISLFTSLFMTRLIFDYWIHRHWLSKLRMLRLFSRPNINFMRIRKPVLTATAALTIVGLGVFLARGEKALSIDFRGGVNFGGRLNAVHEKTKEGLTIGEIRDLVDVDRQRTILKVASVSTLEDPNGVFKNLYLIRYEDGTEHRVSLKDRPTGTTPAEQEQNVKQRASILDDATVNTSSKRSHEFTLETTEKEPELVQLAIDRLFRDKANVSLLAKSAFKVQKVDKFYDLSFYDVDTGEAQPTSPSVVKKLLEREFRVALGNKLGTQDPFSLTGSGRSSDGHFSVMRLEPIDDADVQKATPEILAAAQASFASRPQPEFLDTVDSPLAADMRARALVAIVASWMAILLYLWFRFGSWTFGASAVICLIHDLCFTLGCIAFCHYVHDTFFGQLLALKDFKIDLAAVAALLTLVGYSVNDTIVVFDRIREVRGKNPSLTAQTINDSVNQTLSRTVLASLTVFLVVGVLYIFGGEGVHLFAFVMVVGVIVGTFSSIYVASPLLLIFGEGKQPQGQPVKVKAPQPQPAGA